MSHVITCPSGLTDRVRGMKVREERILADRKLAKSGGQVDELLGACWEETLDSETCACLQCDGSSEDDGRGGLHRSRAGGAGAWNGSLDHVNVVMLHSDAALHRGCRAASCPLSLTKDRA